MTYIFQRNDRRLLSRSLPLCLVAALLLATTSGCSQSSSPEAYNGTREWGACSVIGAFTGAAIGFGLGYGINDLVNDKKKVATAQVCQSSGSILPVGNITCTVVGIPGQTVPIKASTAASRKTSYWIGPVAAIPGAIIGAIAGHYLCDPIFQSPYRSSGYAPPPPPPPSGAENPPPPMTMQNTTPPAATIASTSPAGGHASGAGE